MVVVGLFLSNVSNLQEAMALMNHLQFRVLVCPLVNPMHRSRSLTEDSNDEHLTFSSSDLILESKQWKKVIAKLNCDSFNCDSVDINIRRTSEKLILQEIRLAQHLISRGFIMVKLTSNKNINLARILNSSLKNEKCLVHVPITNVISNHLRRDLHELPHQNRINENNSDPWTWWNNFRIVCDYNPRFRLALELSNEPPSDYELNRWLGEPIDCIIIPKHLFFKKHNKIGLPVEILKLIEIFFAHTIYFVLKGTLNDHDELDNFYDFLNTFLSSCSEKNKGNYNAGVEDKIFIPIQPMDYEKESMYMFQEADAVFFKSYQNAIQFALIDRVPETEIEESKSVLLIFNSIRGLLLKSAFNASKISNRKIKVYVVETNPYNLITLSALKKELWARESLLIVSDLKQLNSVLLDGVDIFITSYIGSFGDNDLLPEILDAAKKYLKSDGISIPCQTTSYLNPIMSSRIYNNIKRVRDLKKEIINGSLIDNNYIIHINNAYHIDAPQKCFTFNYPDCENVQRKFLCLQFKAQLDCILHGFAGYFEAILYKGVTLSIHPQKFTQGLLSYYPYYFPIKAPQMVRVGEEIEINISRCFSTQKVWYEWQLNQPNILPIQNIRGSASSIQKYREE